MDDVDTFATSMHNGNDAAIDVMEKLEKGAQKWPNIQDVCAASTAFHNCLTSILSFKDIKGSLKINYDFRYTMYLHDVKGAPSLIKLIPPDAPNEGLGFRHAPDGNQ